MKMRSREKMILIAAIAAAGIFIFHIAHYMLYCRHKKDPDKSHCAVCRHRKVCSRFHQ